MNSEYFSKFYKTLYVYLLISIGLCFHADQRAFSMWNKDLKKNYALEVDEPKIISNANLNYLKSGIDQETSWYQNFWIKIVLLILLVILIQLGVKLRLRLIRYKNNELTKKVQEHTIQLNHTITELRKTKEKLYLQNESQKLLLASISHDIKNPLNFIAYISKQSYEDQDISTELQNHLKSIYTSSTQLIDFVTSLVSYTKRYNEDHELLLNEVNLHQLISTKVALFKNIAEYQKTSIHIEVSGETRVKLNREFFSIIVHNLLDNAIKNTHFGEIYINCHLQGELLYLSITDTGKGMSPETLAYYRNYKYNIDNPDVQKSYKGLGFKIISELLIIMNGECTIDSSLGKGTAITIQIKVD